MNKNGTVLGLWHTQPTIPLPKQACDCHVHVFGPYESYPLVENRSYTPGPAIVDDLQKHQMILGLERVVLVQPSIYGTDNRCLLNALRVLGPDVARGVAVVDPTTSAETLQALKSAGVKGIRLNLAAAGADRNKAIGELTFASKIVAEMGWHLQIFAAHDTLIGLRDEIEALDCLTILDHFAGATLQQNCDFKNFNDLAALYANPNIVIKLAAPYLVCQPSEEKIFREIIHGLADIDPDRLIWGSNWPHPSGGTGAMDKNAFSPFRGIDDGHLIDDISNWIGDRQLMQKIFAVNPGKIFF